MPRSADTSSPQSRLHHSPAPSCAEFGSQATLLGGDGDDRCARTPWRGATRRRGPDCRDGERWMHDLGVAADVRAVAERSEGLVRHSRDCAHECRGPWAAPRASVVIDTARRPRDHVHDHPPPRCRSHPNWLRRRADRARSLAARTCSGAATHVRSKLLRAYRIHGIAAQSLLDGPVMAS
jgi:hypothetical protein